MATKNIFSQMLNQKAATAPQLTGASIKIQKPPGTNEFAYLGNPNAEFRHPMSQHGNDVSQSVWGRMLQMKKGLKNG